MIPTAVNDKTHTVYGTRCGDGTLTVPSQHGLPVVTADVDALTNVYMHESDVWFNHDASRVLVNVTKGIASIDTRYVFFDAKDMQQWTLPTIGIDRTHNCAYLSCVDRTIVESFKRTGFYNKDTTPVFSVHKEKPSDDEVEALGDVPAVFAVYSLKEQRIEALYTNAPYLCRRDGAAPSDAEPAAKKANYGHIERLRYHKTQNPLRVADVVHVQKLSAYASTRNEEIVRVCAAVTQAMDKMPALRELTADCAHVGKGIYKEIALFRRVLFQDDDFIKKIIGE